MYVCASERETDKERDVSRMFVWLSSLVIEEDWSVRLNRLDKCCVSIPEM